MPQVNLLIDISNAKDAKVNHLLDVIDTKDPKTQLDDSEKTAKLLLRYVDFNDCNLKELINDISEILNNLIYAIEEANIN